MNVFLHDLEALEAFAGTRVPPSSVDHGLGALLTAPAWRPRVPCVVFLQAIQHTFGSPSSLDFRRIGSGWAGLSMLVAVLHKLDLPTSPEEGELLRSWLEALVGESIRQSTAHSDRSGVLERVLGTLHAPKSFVLHHTVFNSQLPSPVRTASEEVPCPPAEGEGDVSVSLPILKRTSSDQGTVEGDRDQKRSKPTSATPERSAEEPSVPEKPVDCHERPIVPTIQTKAHPQPPPMRLLAPGIPPTSPYNHYTPTYPSPGFQSSAHYASHFTSSPSSYLYSPGYSPSTHAPSPLASPYPLVPPRLHHPYSPTFPPFQLPRPQLSIPSLIESALRANPSRQSTVASIVDWITANHPSEPRKRKTWEDLVRAALNSDAARFSAGALLGDTGVEEEEGHRKTEERGRRGRIWRLKGEERKDE